MGLDFLISVLGGSYWAFLTLWLLLLAAAFILSFPEASAAAAAKLARSGNRIRLL
jgi:hypothetical protein